MTVDRDYQHIQIRKYQKTSSRYQVHKSYMTKLISYSLDCLYNAGEDFLVGSNDTL